MPVVTVKCISRIDSSSAILYAEFDSAGEKLTQAPPVKAVNITLHRLNHFSPEQMGSVIQSAQADHLQLGRGEFSGDVIHLLSGGRAFDSGCYTQSILGYAGMPTERVTVGMVIPVQTGSILEGECLDLPHIFLYTEGAELSCRLEPGTRWVCYQVERQELEACGITVPETYRGKVNCSPEQRRRLASVAVAMLNEFKESTVNNGDSSRSARFVEEHFDGLLAAFVSALSPGPSPSRAMAPRTYRRLVRQAQGHMKAHLSDQLRIKDICTTAGVNYKTLERAFGSLLGVTPRRYLSLERLAQARQMLLDSDQKNLRVADVALACGYDEFGRFSRDYRQCFGEYPSHTLSKMKP